MYGAAVLLKNGEIVTVTTKEKMRAIHQAMFRKQ